MRDEEWKLMATVRATCPDCGDVELTTRDVTVRVCADDNTGAYSFRCPSCDMTVLKAAEPHVVDLLVGAGVKVVVWSLPAELRERPAGSPFTHDDLLDFHRILEGESWFDDLARFVQE